MSRPLQCKRLGCRGPVTHCPVYRCYETALGAGAEGQTGSRAASSRVYGAPGDSAGRLHYLRLCSRTNCLCRGLPEFAAARSTSSTCVRLCHVCPRARRFRREPFEGFHSVGYLRVQRRLKTQKSVTQRVKSISLTSK